MLARRVQRETVLQALYMHDMCDGYVDYKHIATFPWMHKDANALSFARELYLATIEQMADIDTLLQIFLESEEKNLSLLFCIDRALLRMGVGELRYFDTEKNIIISEMVILTKKYSDEYTYKLVNSILDNIPKNHNQ